MYPVPKSISDTFPILGTEFTHDPLASSGITKFVYALCNSCFHALASQVDFSKMLFQFRDKYEHLLRADSALAREYEHLKQDLARRYPTDRDAYTSGKTEFVASALGRHGG